MATSASPASFLIRLDPRLREGLQQQIYRSVRRAILDGVLAPGARVPSSRALATDLEGHFARHLRRMRVVYRERLEALVAAAERFCGGVLRVRPVQTGLHALADVAGVDAVRVSREAAARGVEAAPLAAYFAGTERGASGLVLGFGVVRPDASRRGMERLAMAIEAARRR
jgi:GntR family transcriptional regulator/MocR family aminotransferase